MQTAIRVGFAAMLCAAAASTVLQGQTMTDTPLIERAKLFGNPSKAQGRLSPDGKWISWLAPNNGVLNIWVAPADDPAKARPLTAEQKRPIRQHFWAPDSSMILYLNDSGGDEDFLLYGVRAEGGAPKLLTDFNKTTVQLVGISDRHKDRILIGLNNRDAKWHDVWSLDLATG